MLRKLIVLAVVASFALIPVGATAGHQEQGRATASGDAGSNEYFFSSDTCSTDPQGFTWLRQAGSDVNATGAMTSASDSIIQEFDATGGVVYGELYFQNADETSAFEIGFEGELGCESDTVATVTGTWDWGYGYEFSEADELCTPFDALTGRVMIRVDLATQETSTRVIGYFSEGEPGAC